MTASRRARIQFPIATLDSGEAAARLRASALRKSRNLLAQRSSVASDLGMVGDTGKVACATCHSGGAMSDGRAPFTVTVGTGTHTRNAPALVNSSFYEWTNWAGRFAAQWELPLAVAENAVTMNSTRLKLAHFIYDNYKSQYEAVFGALPAALDSSAADAARFPTTGKPGDVAWDTNTAADDKAAVNRIIVNYGLQCRRWRAGERQHQGPLAHPARSERVRTSRLGRIPEDPQRRARSERAIERSLKARPSRLGTPRKACYARSMCIICIDFERGALRPKEARRALREMRGGMDATHVKEIEQKLDEAEPDSSAPQGTGPRPRP